jgi:hypothetical protein
MNAITAESALGRETAEETAPRRDLRLQARERKAIVHIRVWERSKTK